MTASRSAPTRGGHACRRPGRRRRLAAWGLLAAAIAQATAPARAQDGSLAEDLATTDAFVQVCAEQSPDRQARLARAAEARQRCASVNQADIERARASSAYQERRESIVAEMLRMPDEQIRAFCDTLSDERC
ncbi:MAG: hypothetical protein QM766_27765 [Burkholderiaceae bacterium]